jgi:hypothetical protein
MWSSAHDLIKYVQLELAQGVLPDGTRLVSAKNLLIRRAPNVSVGEDRSYGLGLITDKSWDAPLIHHGGALAGFQSDFVIAPDASVGAVLLTNADDGEYLLRPFMRRLLEVLYDGRPEAAADVSAAASRNREEIAAARGGLEFPVPPAIAAILAAHYTSPELGQITVRHDGDDMIFDFGTWDTRVASRHNDDGSTSFITLDPRYDALEFVIVERAGTPALVLSDGQHEYVYVQVPH